MKNLIALISISIALVVFVLPGFAQENETKKWDMEFVQALEKIRSQEKTSGLGYTITEEEALEKAIKTAMDQKAPACEAMKLAVDLNFNPYAVVSGIFSSGAEVDLDQLCMCATESGISKSLMAQAASAAADANMLNRDEITQSQCLREGLGYGEDFQAFESIPIEGPKPTYSASTPG